MKSILEAFRFAWSSRRAWWFTATARTKERFARTTLGSFWLGLSNLLSIATLAVVYGTVFRVQHFGTYVVYLGIGLVIWNSLAGSLQSAPNILRVNSEKIKNFNIHPIYYTLEEWAFQVQTFLQSFALVLLALSFYNHTLIYNLITAGIVPMINLLIFMYWSPVLLCMAGAYFEDLYQLIPIGIQLMFLLSPILYQKSSLGSMQWTADLNPIYRVLSGLRQSLITGNVTSWQLATMMAINTGGVILSVALLSRQRKKLPFIL